MAKHFLAVETRVADTRIKEILKKLYNEEFNEIQPERKHGVFTELENLPVEISSLWWWKMEPNWWMAITNCLFHLRNPALIISQNRTIIERNY